MKLFDIFKRKKQHKVCKNNLKIGLALGGGGARGIAHIGVIKAFEENGIDFDYVAGTSAGSLVGAFYAAGASSQNMQDIIKQVKISDIKSGKIFFVPSKTDGLQKLIIKNLGDIVFSDLKKPFAAVTVDVKTGNEVVFKSGSVAKAVAASCAVPGVFNPVEMNDMVLMDGGLLNTIPSDVPLNNGCDAVVAVDVHHGRGYGTDSTKFIDLLSASIRIMTKVNAMKGIERANIIIQPDVERFKSTKLDGVDEMIQEGYSAAMQVMPQIKKLMGITGNVQIIKEPKIKKTHITFKQRKQNKKEQRQTKRQMKKAK